MNLKSKKLYLFILISILIFTLTITGCSQNRSKSDSKQIGTVTMSITGYEDLAQLGEKEIPITEGMTVLDALYETKFAIDASNGFINSIDGLENGSVEGYPYCGWVYYINGEFAEKSAAEQILKDGDEIKWEFSLSFD